MPTAKPTSSAGASKQGGWLAPFKAVRRLIHHAAELMSVTVREFDHDQGFQMSAALTYRTIFSLIPLLVVSVLALRAFRGTEDLGRDMLERAYDFMGLSSLSLPSDAGAAPAATHPAADALGAASQESSEQRSVNIARLMSNLTDKAASVNFGGIAVIGIVVLIWGALSLVITVEQSFNRIFNTPRGRSWFSRITSYTTILFIGPLLMSVSLAIAINLARGVNHFPWLEPVFAFIDSLSAVLASWLLLWLLYILMPNTSVKRRPAALGALVAALLWEVAKWGFKLYVTKTVPYSKVYGVLGLIPLFLFWVYITWAIILFGLELVFTRQFYSERRFKHTASRAAADLAVDHRMVIPLMAALAEAFRKGATCTDADLAHQLSLPVAAARWFLVRLRAAGLVHAVAAPVEGSQAYSLARPADQITLATLLEAIGTPAGTRRAPADDADSALDSAMARLAAAHHDAARGITLAQVLAAPR